MAIIVGIGAAGLVGFLAVGAYVLRAMDLEHRATYSDPGLPPSLERCKQERARLYREMSTKLTKPGFSGLIAGRGR